VKRRLQRGELKGYQEETPQGFRWIIDLPDDSASSNHHSAAPADAPATAGAEETLRELVDVLKDEVSQLRHCLPQGITTPGGVDYGEEVRAGSKVVFFNLYNPLRRCTDRRPGSDLANLIFLSL
jgi:hypothetical protein